MMFRQRPIAAPDTLGQRLRQLRVESRHSVDDWAKVIGVAPKYIEAIETGNYQALPGHVYARNFVRLYVEHVGLNLEAAMTRFEEEYRVVTAARPSKRPLLIERPRTPLPWIRRHGRYVLVGVALAIVLSYFGWQVARLFTPPMLTIEPNRDFSTTERSVTIRGTTEAETHVTINNQDVEVTKAGRFTVRIDLQPGLNTINVSSAKKYSRPRVVTRNVLVENQAGGS